MASSTFKTTTRLAGMTPLTALGAVAALTVCAQPMQVSAAASDQALFVPLAANDQPSAPVRISAAPMDGFALRGWDYRARLKR
jgi:hypothetical protein